MATRAASRSLSSVVTLGIGGLLAIAALGASTTAWMVHSTRVGGLELARRAHEDESARQKLTIALLDQEAAQRRAVASGDPTLLEAYQRGLREEEDAWTALRAVSREAATAEALSRVRAAVDAWRAQVVLPQLPSARTPSPARLRAAWEEDEAAFERIRAALAQLARAQAERSAARGVALARDARRATAAGVALLAALVATGALLAVWSKRRVALPLEALAARVEAGERLEHTEPASAIREIATLRTALVRLDRRVTEREGVLRAEREDAELLGRFGAIVQQTTSETELHRLLVRFLELAVAPTAISVFSLDPGDNHLTQVFPVGGADEQLRFPFLVEPMRCRGVRSARDILSACADDPGACDCPLAAASAHLCLPLVATGQVIGLVALQAGETGHWTLRRVHLAQALTATASTTLNSIRLVARSRDSALRDALTHAYNRRFLLEVLPKLVHQTARSRSPLSALMIDVDRFKDVNDMYGHDAGDRVLAAVARCLSEQIRISDTLVRYGGEEFAVLLPNTALPGALAIAERAREAVEQTRTAIPQAEQPLTVTVSVGVATLPEHGTSGDDLLVAADKALFRAKEAGRNRVIAAAAQGEPSATLALAAGS